MPNPLQDLRESSRLDHPGVTKPLPLDWVDSDRNEPMGDHREGAGGDGLHVATKKPAVSGLGR